MTVLHRESFNLLGEGEQQGYGGLGNARRAVCRNIGDNHTGRGRRGSVHDVVACGQHSYILQPRAGGDCRRGYWRFVGECVVQERLSE